MFLDIAGNKVFALSFGKGPKTILAHSGWVGNFEDWIATLAPLSETYRTVVYDHRGTGETVVPPDRISHEALVDDVFAVMEAMAIERCILAGFSRGVMTVMRAVLRDPSRFDGLILMNGTGGVVAPGTTPVCAGSSSAARRSRTPSTSGAGGSTSCRARRPRRPSGS